MYALLTAKDLVAYGLSCPSLYSDSTGPDCGCCILFVPVLPLVDILTFGHQLCYTERSTYAIICLPFLSVQSLPQFLPPTFYIHFFTVCVNTQKPIFHPSCSLITKYSSTLYIGMDEVFAHYACTFENSDLHFHFQ